MNGLRLGLACVLLLQLSFAPLWGADTLPYHLVDREQYAIFEEDQEAKKEAELALEDPPDDAQLLKYTTDFWRQAVTSVEGSYTLDKEPEPIPDLTLLNPTLSLPLYGTSIALTGRYVLGLKLAGKRYKTDPNSTIQNRDDRNVQMEQQLQLKMQGKILDRVFVDIDYDDQREEEKTLSVAYRGKAGELVQLAEFGDINLALPQTEFIAYEKQLFGAKMHLQHKNANLYLIGSQTKGSSKQKQFIGSSVSEIVSLADKNYLRRTYYDLTFGGNVKPYPSGSGLPPPVEPDAHQDWITAIGQISVGTEEIYLDANKTSSDFVPVYKTATDYLGGSYRYEAKWELLTRGVDYVIDYAQGTIQFKRSITAASVIAVDYLSTNGARLSDVGEAGTIKLIKTANEKPVTSSSLETASKMELKTYYNVGAQKITPDNGKGNFILQLQDANGQQVSDIGLSYPSTINMNFDEGFFYLDYRIPDPSLYNATPVSSNNYTFKTQYASTVKTYFIEAGIVVQSESVKLNGRQLTRNNDYYIDYTSGFITFYKSDAITENDVIDITYDTTDGDSSNNSVVGGRLDYKLFDKIVMGATMIKEGGDKPSSVPQVGAYSKDLLVYGADIHGKDIKLADPLAVDFGVEGARSIKKQNLFGYAMIDSMNDTEERVGGSMIFRDWIFAANPTASKRATFLNTVRWDTQDVPSLEINPNSVAGYNDKQQVLVLNYDFTQAQAYDANLDEVSIVYPLSANGVDLSEKTSFQLTMLGEEGGPQVNFTFGDIEERSDSSAGMYTTCSNGALAPKTEDVNCRGSLAPNEDVGWVFTNPDGSEENYNPFTHNIYNYETQPNGRIDTQDLNGNGKFDPENIPLGGNFGYAGTAIEGLTDNRADNTSWKTFTQPLKITNKSDWTSVHHLRITIKKGAKMKGQIKIAGVALSGTAWSPVDVADPSVFSVEGINNVENSDYQPIFNDTTGDGLRVFNYLYGSINEYRENTKSANVLDQALNLNFDTSSAAYITTCNAEGECYANRNFRTMDFSQHRELRFLLHGAGTDKSGSEFFLKVGTDVNYDKIIVPVDFEGWHLISVRMEDSNGDGIADTLVNTSEPSYRVRVRSHRAANGLINFREVSLILAGISRTTDDDGNLTGSGSAGEVWLNMIHLAEAITQKGDAYKAEVDVRLDEWGSAGAKYTHKDGNFQTPLAVATEQETTDEAYYVKIDRIKEFPMRADLTRSTTVTPVVGDSTNYNTISLLDKGEVKREAAVVRGDFIKENFPRVGLEYTRESTSYSVMKRQDESHTYGATLTHSTAKFKNIAAGYHYTDSSVEYDASRHRESENYYNTDENTQKMNVKATYQPSSSFNFTPSYSLTKVKEDRSRQTDTPESYSYPKAMTQKTGFNSTWKISKWLAPALSYNITTTENNNLNAKKSQDGKTTFAIGEVKTLNRSSDGGMALTLNANELLPKNKLFDSLVVSSSYRMQDADTWWDVDSGFDSRKALWIRGSLNGVGAYGYRKNLTLRDTFTSTQRWNPFSQYDLSGTLAPLKTISVINNFSRVLQNNEQTGTTYDSTSTTLPDITFSISDLEKFFSAGRWLRDSNLKLHYSWIKQTNVGMDEQVTKQAGSDLRFMLINYFDTLLNYSQQSSDKKDLRAGTGLEQVNDRNMSAQTSFYIKSMRITPKVLFNSHEKRLVRNVLSESSRKWEPSLNLRWDFNLPRGWRMPFVNKMYRTTNRVIWNTTFTYTDKSSPVEVKENYRLFDCTTAMDYEVSQNLRFTLSGGVSVLNHDYVESEDYTSYNVAANVTVQF